MKWVLGTLVLLLILFAYFYKIAPPVLRGKFGEVFVKFALGRNKAGKQHIINNVTVVVDEKSRQIDHILVNDHGIFCIETKNYSGRIYGDSDQLQWTQVLAYGKEKNKLYNPVKQNWTHVKRLSQLLNAEYPIYSLVVFVQSNTRYINANNVVGLCGIQSFLRETGSPEALSPEQIDSLAQQIQTLKDSNTVTTKEHISEIRQMQENVKNNICPRCVAP